MKQIVSIFFLFAILIRINAQSAPEQNTELTYFPSGQKWTDNNGIHINAHGGGFLFFQGKYYWFGEYKVAGSVGNSAQVGVSCYSSLDLLHWQNEGIALKVEEKPESEITKGCIIERPKVIYNKKTNKFVMWFHLELKGKGYAASRTAVAVSDSVTGPYKYLYSYRPNDHQWPVGFKNEWKQPRTGEDQLKWWTTEWMTAVKEGLFVRRDFNQGQMSRDMTVFVDDDGKAYHIHSSEENLTLHISELSDDYLSFTDQWICVFSGGHNEAPTIFKYQGNYFLITSGCTGWAPNAARSAVSKSIWGPWEPLGNPCIGKDSSTTFHSQGTYILPVERKKDLFIFVADRWEPKNPIDGTYIWLPISFESGRPIIRWKDKWNPDAF
jgi:hypothetical protein